MFTDALKHKTLALITDKIQGNLKAAAFHKETLEKAAHGRVCLDEYFKRKAEDLRIEALTELQKVQTAEAHANANLEAIEAENAELRKLYEDICGVTTP